MAHFRHCLFLRHNFILNHINPVKNKLYHKLRHYKSIAFFTIAFILSIAISAQTPQSFRYQAVARDNPDNLPVTYQESLN